MSKQDRKGHKTQYTHHILSSRTISRNISAEDDMSGKGNLRNPRACSTLLFSEVLLSPLIGNHQDSCPFLAQLEDHTSCGLAVVAACVVER